MVSEGHKFCDQYFGLMTNRIFLNFIHYWKSWPKFKRVSKRAPTLGRWNILLSMNKPLLIEPRFIR
jgi:hypothetical protein